MEKLWDGGKKHMVKIYEKLLQIQTKLKAPKSLYNKFGNFYHRNCEDILEALKPLLAQTKTVVLIRDEVVRMDERYYIKAVVRFVDCETGEAIENCAYAREEKEKKGADSSQITGAASSYARKCALNGLFCIDDSKDTDSGQPSKATSETKNSFQRDTSGKIDDKRIQIIKDLAKKYEDRGMKIEKLLKMYQLKDIADMTIAQYSDCINKLSLYEKGEKKKNDDTDRQQREGASD